MRMSALREFSVTRGGSVDPSRFKNEIFDLYSIAAYDNRYPEVLPGSDIGSSKKKVQPGDVLLSRIVPHIRRVWVVGADCGRRQIASGEWITYRGDEFDPDYLRHFLLSDPFHQQFMRTVSGVGGSLLRARPSEVEKIEIRLPPLPEQRRIAAILDKTDSVRCKRQESIRLTEELLCSVFLEMFGDPVTNPKGWPQQTIGSALQSIDSGWSANGEDRIRQTDEWAVLKISSVTTGRFVPSECKVVSKDSINRELVTPKRGDLLFSRANTRELVAATCLVEKDESRLFLPDKLWRINPEKSLVCSEYLKYLLSHARFRETLTKQATGTSGSMLNISMAKLRSLKIPLPPLQIQEKFAGIVWRNLDMQSKIKDFSTEVDSLFGSLVQRAFRGEI